MIVAVTGASGFLGRWIVDALLARGLAVRAVVRSPERLRGADRRVAVAGADLLDRAALARAFEGADVVIGNAGLASPRALGWDENERVNRGGAENVAAAAAEAGVRRLVHVSTIGVYDMPPPWRLDRPIPEDHPLAPPERTLKLGAYRRSKILAERAAQGGCARAGIGLTIVRPGALFGPGDPNILPALRRAARWPALPAPTACFPIAYVRDVAPAIAAVAARGDLAGRALNLAGDPYVPLIDFLRAWKRAAGRGPRLVPIPVRAPIAYDITAAQQLLGFRNRPLEEALRETLAIEPL